MPASNAGVFIAIPAEARTDCVGVVRSNPPDVGVYEFAGLALNQTGVYFAL